MPVFSPIPSAIGVRTARGGFALIMSLGLMALIVLLVVSLTALTHVENAAAEQQQHAAIAKQNALAGAYQALGILQKEMGPDQRVSARADIGGQASMENPYWVGVWATDSIDGNGTFSGTALSKTPRRWLVSMPEAGGGKLTPQSTIPPSQRIEIAKALPSSGAVTGSLAQAVSVCRIKIQDSAADSIGGHYAWWIADEGLKASVALGMPDTQTATQAHNQIAPETLQRRLQLHKTRQGIETLTADKGFAIDETLRLSQDEASTLERVQNAVQLPLLSERTLFSSNRVQALSHDLTGTAYGVLASTLTVASGQTLKADFSTASNITPAVGASSEGMLAFLNAYKTVIRIGEKSAFPLTPTTPNDGDSPVIGKAYFSIAPVLTEWELSSSLAGGNYQKTFTHAIPVNSLNFGARMGGWFELWNPYTIAIAPEGGHLQVRIRDLPTFKVRYWYDSNLNARDPRWKPNTPSISSTFNFYDVWKSSKGDFLALHLQTPASTSATPALYEGGNPLYWFGMRSADASAYKSNDYTKGSDFLSAYGPAKEIVVEKRSETQNIERRYFQTEGAITWKSWGTQSPPVYPINASEVTEAFCQNILLRDNTISQKNYPTMISELKSGGGYSSYGYSPYYVLWKCYTAITLDWANSRPKIELWYVRDDDETSAVFLSRMTMPAVDSTADDRPPDGSIMDPRHQPLAECDNKRFSLHYLRVDSSDIPAGARRTRGNWITDTAAIDPRAPLQSDNAFSFFGELSNPNNGYTDYETISGGFRIFTFPDPDATLTQQIDRKTGTLNAGGNAISSEAIGNFILGKSSTATLSSEGGTHLAHRVSLFEIPTSVPISLGVLQHLTLHGRRAYSIGNSWGKQAGIAQSNLNLVFDKGYLSALPTSALNSLDTTQAMPNPYLLPLWRGQTEAPDISQGEVLSYFLVRGAFNINSTSVAAWRAMLSGGWIDAWAYTQMQGADDTTAWTQIQAKKPLKNAFFRFAHTADETFSAHDNWTGTAPMGDVKNKYYRRGIRRLTHAQIDVMAQIIVEKIKARGAPFSSMAEFLSASVTNEPDGPSVLEYALAPSDSADLARFNENGGTPIYRWSQAEMTEDGDDSGPEEGDIDKGASADLSQADLLNTLAPVLQARSDTFKIRAYGDVTGNDNRVLASAVCELTVQRTPDPVKNPDQPQSRLAPGEDGRAFKIIAIRWLRDS